MNPIVTAVISVLVFGLLIFIHEFGHFICARIFHVTVKEFALGMGPKLVWYDSKKTGTRYCLCLLPFGGYVAMAGENDGTENEEQKEKAASDPNAFNKKPAWQRLIITGAGAFVNILAGFLAVLILCLNLNLGSTTVYSHFTEEELGVAPTSFAILDNDEILKIGNRRVRTMEAVSYEIMRNGVEPVDVTVRRNGEVIVLEDVVFPSGADSGIDYGVMDFCVYALPKTVDGVITYSTGKSCLIVRMCWESLYDLIRGRYSVQAVSGPVGISSAIGEAASYGFMSLLSLVAIISINLGVMNLLPLPALDGGRFLTTLVEMITKKRMPEKVESIINGVGLILLVGLSVVIMIKDIIGLIG